MSSKSRLCVCPIISAAPAEASVGMIRMTGQRKTSRSSPSGTVAMQLTTRRPLVSSAASSGLSSRKILGLMRINTTSQDKKSSAMLPHTRCPAARARVCAASELSQTYMSPAGIMPTLAMPASIAEARLP